jgi:hypothetical protein
VFVGAVVVDVGAVSVHARVVSATRLRPAARQGVLGLRAATVPLFVCLFLGLAVGLPFMLLPFRSDARDVNEIVLPGRSFECPGNRWEMLRWHESFNETFARDRQLAFDVEDCHKTAASEGRWLLLGVVPVILAAAGWIAWRLGRLEAMESTSSYR